MEWFTGIAGFVAGGALIWFGKENIQRWVLGANALSRKLREKADAIADAARK
jgi:hypothetical protein